MEDDSGKIKFDRFDLLGHSNMIVLIPTVVFIWNEPYFARKSLQIYVKWLKWSMRWRWLEKL